MKLRFGIKNQTDGQTNGDIEAPADARRALNKRAKLALLKLVLHKTHNTIYFTMKSDALGRVKGSCKNEK